MNRQIKAAHFSLVLHGLILWGAINLGQHTLAMRPPVAIDFSILGSSGPAMTNQPEAAPETKPAPPPVPPVEKKVVPKPVVKKTPQQQAPPPKKMPPAEEKSPPADTIPVAASTETSTAQDSEPAAGAAVPSTAVQAPGSWQARGGGSGGIFSVGQLDGPLAVLTKPPPAYPPAAKRRNIEGWIKVKFLVDEHGQVGQISVQAAEPEGIFEQSVLQCVKNWRFKPGTVRGMAVKTLVEQTISFKLEG